MGLVAGADSRAAPVAAAADSIPAAAPAGAAAAADSIPAGAPAAPAAAAGSKAAAVAARAGWPAALPLRLRRRGRPSWSNPGNRYRLGELLFRIAGRST